MNVIPLGETKVGCFGKPACGQALGLNVVRNQEIYPSKIGNAAATWGLASRQKSLLEFWLARFLDGADFVKKIAATAERPLKTPAPAIAKLPPGNQPVNFRKPAKANGFVGILTK